MSIRTLLVDDAPLLRQLVRMVLEADGSFHVVAEAGDGVEAIVAAREHRPELILLDLAMPRMGGMEALPLLRAAVPEARVVVFTGFEGTGVVESARAAGAARVLHKGLDPHALCRELLDLVGPTPEGPLGSRAPGESSTSGTARSARNTRSARRARRGRLRVPVPVAVVLAVAFLLALYGALAGFAGTTTDDPYGGDFQEASFQEPGLADPGTEPAIGLGGGGVPAYTVVVPSQSLRWTVDADGGVRMEGGSSWQEARAAFTAWCEGRGLGTPSFDALRLTTPDGEELHRDALLPEGWPATS